MNTILHFVQPQGQLDVALLAGCAVAHAAGKGPFEGCIRGVDDAQSLLEGPLPGLLADRSRIGSAGDPSTGPVGIVMQGGMYNGVIRALQRLGLADVFGDSRIPLYVLNVTYPLVDSEFLAFCEGKQAILVVEEGQPAYIEDALAAILYKAHGSVHLSGKDVLPTAGEYIGQHVLTGVSEFLKSHAPDTLPARGNGSGALPAASTAMTALATSVPVT